MGAAGVMAGLEGAKSLSSFIVALNQARQLKNMKKEWEGKFPTYQIPESEKQALAASRFRAMVGAPGAAAARERIGRQSAESMYNARQVGSSPAALLAAASGIDMNTKESMANQTAREEQQQASSFGQYLQSQHSMSGYLDKQYKINKFDPYMQAMKTIGALRQSQWENLSHGINALAGAGESYLYATNPDLAANMKTGSGGAGDAGGNKTSFTSPAPDLSFPDQPTGMLQFPQSAVGGFNNAYYGMEIPPATQQRYGMYDSMNQFMNQVYSNPMDYTG
jgi:hypothetical protein